MKTMWFLRIGLVLAFTLASCAPSTTDTVADGADKSTTASSGLADTSLLASTEPATNAPLPTQTDIQLTAPPSSTPPTAPEPTSAPANSSPVPPTAAAAAGLTRFVIDPAQSTVSYGVGETFLGQNNRYAYAVAATSVVSGEIMVDFENPAASTVGEITVDISAFQSDKERRDKAIQTAGYRAANSRWRSSRPPNCTACHRVTYREMCSRLKLPVIYWYVTSSTRRCSR